MKLKTIQVLQNDQKQKLEIEGIWIEVEIFIN